MEFVLHGVTVRIEGDRVTYGARTYHKEAVPMSLRAEIKKAQTVAAASANNTNTTIKRKVKRESNSESSIPNGSFTARARQAKNYRR